MRETLRNHAWTLCSGIVALLLALCVLGLTHLVAAHAEEKITQEKLDALQEQVEQSAVTYNKAVADVDRLEQEIAENQALLEELNEQLPMQEERFNEAVRFMYVYQMDTSFVLDFLFSSSDFESLIGAVEYIDRLQENNYKVMVETAAYKAQVESTAAQLDSDLKEAQAAREQAARSLEEAKAARQEAMRLAAEQAAREEAARKAAAEAAAASSAGGGSSSHSSGGGSVSHPTVSSGDVDWSLSRDAFIAEWAPRINSYLAGSPLSGYGYNFAAAAWDYGVDPRWSPAIACVESGKGANCFRSHNAWGWGSKSWDSWEEAIDAHVNGLHRIYGATLTYSGAQMYCPTNPDGWYEKVLKEMNKI